MKNDASQLDISQVNTTESLPDDPAIDPTWEFTPNYDLIVLPFNS